MSNSAYEFSANESIEDFENGHLFHVPSNKHYEMTVEEGKFVMTRYRLGKDGVRTGVLKQTADFVIGSGNHARTYLYRDPSGAMYQLPVVWYSQSSKWAMAPGYDHANHDDFTRLITRECMFCHNAYPTFEAEPDTFLTPDRFSQELPHGIGCQRCHGPGDEHIRVAELDTKSPDVLKSIVNPAKLDDQLRDDVCNQCHFQPTSSRMSILRTFDRDVYSFQPGQKLTEFQSYFEFADAEATDLFEVNHHSYRLYQSKCYISSKGALSCVSCHDPHAKVAVQNRTSHYRERCWECHGKSDCLDIERGRQPDADCIVCHMPARHPEDVNHMIMTDHKISRPADEKKLIEGGNEAKLPANQRQIKHYAWLRSTGEIIKPMQEVLRKLSQLVDKDSSTMRPLFGQIQSGVASGDEPKIRLAQAMLELGQSSEALKLLDAVSESGKRSSLVQTNLGLGLIQTKQFVPAVQCIEKAITLEPVDPNAHFNLALAYFNSGNRERAFENFERAVKLHPNQTKAWFVWGVALTRDEKFDLAESYFQRALQINPDFPDAHLSLAKVQRLQGKYRESTRTLEYGRLSQPTDIEIAKELGLTSLEAVARQLIESSESLQSARDLAAFKQPDSESTILLVMALLQNGFNEEAMQAIGSVDETDLNPDRLLIAAIGQAKSNQSDSALKFYRIAKQQLENRFQSPTRLQTLILEMADAVVGKVSLEKD